MDQLTQSGGDSGLVGTCASAAKHFLEMVTWKEQPGSSWENRISTASPRLQWTILHLRFYIGNSKLLAKWKYLLSLFPNVISMRLFCCDKGVQSLSRWLPSLPWIYLFDLGYINLNPSQHPSLPSNMVAFSLPDIVVFASANSGHQDALLGQLLFRNRSLSQKKRPFQTRSGHRALSHVPSMHQPLRCQPMAAA